MADKRNTIAVDFDGVLHGYNKGWQDGTIYDGPVDGAAQAMAALQAFGYYIVIYSTRCHDRTVNGELQHNQAAEVEAWLKKHEIPFDEIWTEPGKPLCKLFVDDNAYRFDPQSGWRRTCVYDIDKLIRDKHK